MKLNKKNLLALNINEYISKVFNYLLHKIINIAPVSIISNNMYFKKIDKFVKNYPNDYQKHLENISKGLKHNITLKMALDFEIFSKNVYELHNNLNLEEFTKFIHETENIEIKNL